eukprot:TRINITY_DN795_c0_g1_i1.p2 TRINITY_DN795_c0_g1~~TRINITY_DN795_c0_g1_i1.p2  ORF type:complete len:259 (-),score=49.42 TRINITY_DN795_c0_g1_i1:877-1653(-)
MLAFHRRALTSLAGVGTRGYAAKGAKAKGGAALDIEEYEERISTSVAQTMQDVLSKYLAYSEAAKGLHKPLGSLTTANVQAYLKEVKKVEQSTGFSIEEAMMDEYEAALAECDNNVRIFLDYLKDKGGASKEINSLVMIVDQLEEKYQKTFVKNQDKQMDKEYETQAKDIGLQYLLRPLTKEELDQLKLTCTLNLLEKAETRAKNIFARQLAYKLGIGEVELLKRFADRGLDFTAEFKKVFDGGSQNNQRLGLATIYG